MKVLTYKLFLEQPLLATAQEGEPNSSRSFGYVPGSQIRGLLIGRHREVARVSGDNLLADPVARRRFFSGATRFLHAYPLLGAGDRALPTSLALRKPKGQSSKAGFTALNLADPGGQALLAQAGPTVQYQPLGEPFCAQLGDVLLHSFLPERTVAIHIQRDRGYGRARRGSGEVFRYDALAAGQWLAGAILCDADEDAAALHELLVGEPMAWLGRSRSANYGRVRIEGVQEEGGGWRELGGDPPVAGDTLTMALLSDLLLRDPAGRDLVAPDAETLSAALGFSVEVLGETCFTATTLAGSYNTTARLPAVQRHALRAGGVITLRARGPLRREALAAVEWAGLGERRAEGFGRVAFGWLTGPAIEVSRGAPYRGAAPAHPERLSAPAGRLAALMAGRLLARQIDEAIARFVRDEVAEAPGVVAQMPASSQLGRVRVLIRRALPRGDVSAVRAGLAGVKQAAREQFERARIAGQPLDQWLDGLLAEPTADGGALVWSILGLRPTSVRVASTPPLADALLARVTALRLAEAALAAAARQRRREAL
ncbi:MAG TPA: hypothetical protein PKD53_17325 [Chloroflexaceae bacterium]|nr:hypothetical protein [Chloroflexaceae bacterium]